MYRKLTPILGTFLGDFWEVFGKYGFGTLWQPGGQICEKKNYKGRCKKRTLGKCRGICKTYDTLQSHYADTLQSDSKIKEFQCNVPLDDLDFGKYTTDFLCILENGDIMVRECVSRDHLTKPMTAKLLDISRNYWLSRGVKDWGLVINAEK